jgi:uncharacterized protein YcbX
MTCQITQIWRHPIKAHGFEALTSTKIKAGQTMPWDRVWAATHEATKVGDGSWERCSNFSRGAKAPALMAVAAKLDEHSATLTLTQPDHPPLTFQPDRAEDVARFVDWVHPMMPEDRAATAGLIRVTGQGMTDTPFPSISLGNLASLRALSQKIGQDLDQRRFRINLWVDGLAPWEEFEWPGRQIAVGDCAFKIEDRITRCTSTMANPDTGRRDADPLRALDAGWGHQDFGVALIAETDGQLNIGDTLELTK